MFHALLAPSIFFFPDFLCVFDKAIEGNKKGCPTLWLHVVCVMHWGSNQTFGAFCVNISEKNKTKNYDSVRFADLIDPVTGIDAAAVFQGSELPLLEIKTMISPTQIGAVLFMIKVIVIRKHGEQVWNIHWSWSRKTTNPVLTWADGSLVSRAGHDRKSG